MVNLKVAPNVLGFIGALVGIVSGIVALVQQFRPTPAVHVTVSKSPLWLSPALIPSAKDPAMHWVEQQVDLGIVTVEVRNDSSDNLDRLQVQLKDMTDFRGMVIADGAFGSKEEERQWETKWRGADSNSPVLDLPPLLRGSSVKVQAFGSNWDKVDPHLNGPREVRTTWMVYYPASFRLTGLIKYHLWIVLVALLLLTSSAPFFKHTV